MSNNETEWSYIRQKADIIKEDVEVEGPLLVLGDRGKHCPLPGERRANDAGCRARTGPLHSRFCHSSALRSTAYFLAQNLWHRKLNATVSCVNGFRRRDGLPTSVHSHSRTPYMSANSLHSALQPLASTLASTWTLNETFFPLRMPAADARTKLSLSMHSTFHTQCTLLRTHHNLSVLCRPVSIICSNPSLLLRSLQS